MPYVFVYTMFPPHKTKEIAQMYVETTKDFNSAARGLTKMVIQNAVKSTENGIESISVHDVKEGNLEKFLNVQTNYMVNYHDIEGFRYKIEVRNKVTEAMEMLGMKAPEPL